MQDVEVIESAGRRPAAVLDQAARYHHGDGRLHRLVAAHPPPEEKP